MKAAGSTAPTSKHATGWKTLALGALGVVFGDIGTSPLYSVQTVFSEDHNAVKPTVADVYGSISLIFWSLTLIVSVKYVLFILRADNDGEGGIMALAALSRRTAVNPKRMALVMVLGVLGACLFYGDSVITPAISVMSAIEGLSVPAPSLASLEVPIGAVIIIALFVVQRFGTHHVGRLFGPVMIVWFTVIAAMGVNEVIHAPEILGAASPTYALAFVVLHPYIAFIAMGAVVLAITGAEALYADMGHFGRMPIQRAWFFLVFPALLMNYLGQGALILRDPKAIANPFFNLAPGWAQLPLVVLATLATVIASQAVISGAFSVSQQAQRLGYLPRLTIRQTSEHERGQIYVPSINWLLFGGVMILLVVFQSSQRLATAYGLAVTGTFLLTTTLFLMHAQSAWAWSTGKLLLLGVPLFALEGTFFAANSAKVLTGGWLPLVIAVIVATVMFTWQRGRTLVTDRREAMEGPVSAFLAELRAAPPMRADGTAVFLHPTDQTTPLALLENYRFNQVIHQQVVIVSTDTAPVPHVPDAERVHIQAVGDPYDAISHVTLTFGFQDPPDIPEGLKLARREGLSVVPDEAFYFVSRITVHGHGSSGLNPWRKRLFIGLAHNAANPAEYYRLPEDRTVVMGAQVSI